MGGNLYQLRSHTKRVPGEYFPVDGPHDTHGVVVKCEHKPEPNKLSGYKGMQARRADYLNLVRGTGHGAQGRRGY